MKKKISATIVAQSFVKCARFPAEAVCRRFAAKGGEV
jgi:hypothetical protein